MMTFADLATQAAAYKLATDRCINTILAPVRTLAGLDTLSCDDTDILARAIEVGS